MLILDNYYITALPEKVGPFLIVYKHLIFSAAF
nr:MAG TPA: hypothetical protein [Caudoviricetes sp.]